MFQGCEYTQEERIVSGKTKWQNDFLLLSNDTEEYKLQSTLTGAPISGITTQELKETLSW